MVKISIEEKRLENLRRQLFGKQEQEKKPQVTLPNNLVTALPSRNTLISDTYFLRSDLLKILILSFLAIALQLLLYLSLTNKIIKLTF